MLAQVDDVMVPVTPGPMDAPTSHFLAGISTPPGSPKPTAPPRPPGAPKPPKILAPDRWVGVFLDGVIVFSVFAAAWAFSALASAIYDDIRELAGW